MPNPVAEVVERLDVLQEIDAAIEDAQAGQMEHDIIVTLQLAKAEIERLRHVAKQGLAKCTPEHTWAEWVADRNAEIERLSRERDTGVPEVLALIDDTCLECRQNALLLDGEDGIRSQAAGDVLQKLGDEVRAMLSTLRKRRRLDVT